MRRIRYSVAASLDGFIAGPNGEYDWIVIDPEIDFKAVAEPFDTVFAGRRTFEGMTGRGESGPIMGMKTYVFSTTLRPEDHPQVTIVSGDAARLVASLRQEDGKDIWLFGGGELFRSLALEGLVDSVEVAVIPVLLGDGVPLFPPPGDNIELELTGRRIYEATGTVALEYAVKRPSGSATGGS